MEKEQIIQQVIVSANVTLKALQEGGDLDLVSLARWTESLARFVLYSKKQHHLKKYLLDIVSHLYQLTYTLTDEHRAAAIQILQDFVASVESGTKSIRSVDEEIEWQPPIRDDGGRLGYR